jgi:hypothetical protein
MAPLGEMQRGNCRTKSLAPADTVNTLLFSDASRQEVDAP